MHRTGLRISADVRAIALADNRLQGFFAEVVDLRRALG
jgi:hypothetical protein